MHLDICICKYTYGYIICICIMCIHQYTHTHTHMLFLKRSHLGESRYRPKSSNYLVEMILLCRDEQVFRPTSKFSSHLL